MGESEFLNAAIAEKEEGRIGTAFESLLQVLRFNPTDPKARLLLAELFYRGGSHELAVEEVRKLRERIPESESLARLLQALDPLSQQGEKPDGESAAEQNQRTEEKGVVAEVEFDLDDIELLEEKTE